MGKFRHRQRACYEVSSDEFSCFVELESQVCPAFTLFSLLFGEKLKKKKLFFKNALKLLLIYSFNIGTARICIFFIEN